MHRRHHRKPSSITLCLTTALLLAACAGGLGTGASSDQGGSATTAGVSLGSGAGAASQELVSANGALTVTLTAAESQVPFEDGTRWAMTYNGSAAGPTLRVRPGDTLTVKLVNKLSDPTSLHTHGLHVSPVGNGDNPFTTVDPGMSKTYVYPIPVSQPAGTFWYHPHAHGLAAEQVASGLSGALIVEDDVDDALDLVATDRVLLVTDPPLTAANPWGHGAGGSANAHGGMDGMGMDGMGMDGMVMRMVGRAGPHLLTNGRDGIDLLDSGGSLERVRVVNATASSRLVLSWTGSSMEQISSEGGRLATAQERDTVALAPGERTELVLIPGSAGGQLLAQRLSNDGSGVPLGGQESIARLNADAGRNPSVLPAVLAMERRDLFASGVRIAEWRVITLDGHMSPSINGRRFDPGTVNFEARESTVEEWVFRNRTATYHPIHLHSWPFQVQGEHGWQDVVEVPPYSEAVIRVTFDDFGGTTVLHCHILDHEDAGMMSVIRVT